MKRWFETLHLVLDHAKVRYPITQPAHAAGFFVGDTSDGGRGHGNEVYRLYSPGSIGIADLSQSKEKTFASCSGRSLVTEALLFRQRKSVLSESWP